ncbi:MAG: PQQ-binding-like beta-propeller repeat protein [Cyclobacteriaceae bacterium]
MRLTPINYPHDVKLLNKIIGFCFVLMIFISCQETADDKSATWEVAGATRANTKYSSATQINRENVHHLTLAWEYQAGEQGYSIQCNPIVIDTVLYGTSPRVQVFAIDARTGEEIWWFDPNKYEVGNDRLSRSTGANRGVTWWSDGEKQTIFFGRGPFMYALDAKTGKPRLDFGEKGRIDLLQNLDREIDRAFVNASSPAITYKDLLIVGAQLGEGTGVIAPGHVRAFDVHTGERKWIFHTIPHPGEYGHETWPEDAWQTFGGSNPWGGFSMDEARGILYFGTGSASNDHFGIERTGDNLFSNCVMALNVETGERLWHYQVVHHDLWDYDVPTPPSLITVNHEGQMIDAVAQVTKVGMVFVFDRVTGEPLFPIEEKPVKQSEVPGEVSSPTQPFPTLPPPYARHGFRETDITDRTEEAHAFVREHVWEKYGASDIYDPPSFEGGVVFPQFNGGTDWGGAAVDVESGVLYVNASDEPELIQVLENDDPMGYPFKVTGHQPVKDNEGYPISTPPWGTLNAIDLNVGEILWKVPLGHHPGLEHEPPTGSFNMGGPIVTAGGLVFIGAAMDEMFRAYDKETGALLWETKLPAGGYATPSTYMVDGKQYVVIAAGGGGKPGTRPGNSFLAYALPDETSQGVSQSEVSRETLSEAARLYMTRCAPCHQFNGQGTGDIFPPLSSTDWVTGEKSRLIRIVLGGLGGEIEVNGKKFDGEMPPWKEFLSDDQVATILTYIRTSWGNNAAAVTPDEVKTVRMKTQDRQQLWTAGELK